MKNKDLLEMVLQLRRAKFGLEALKTEGGNHAFMSVDLYEVQISTETMIEFFGLNVTLSPRKCDKYPIAAHAEYKGVPFIAIMDEQEAKDKFGYEAEAAA